MLFNATITADSLHVRQGPGSAHDSLGFAHREQIVSIDAIDGSGTWARADVAGIGEGWCSARYLVPVADGNAFPWLAVATQEIGIRERPGPMPHPRIWEYLASVDNLSELDRSSDETPWCSCFMNWCVEQCGIDGTNAAWAKSWHNWRKRLNGSPRTGAIAVFERVTAKNHAGHVGICIAQEDDQLLLLGGNQSNAVRYSWYPVNGEVGGTRYTLLSLRGL